MLFIRLYERLSLTISVSYKPHPVLVRALDIMFILHADHEMNCSTAAMRHIASSLADPYSAMAGAAAALFGPLHGGANEAVLHMLEGIGSKENVAQFIADVKSKKRLLMGTSIAPHLVSVSERVHACVYTFPLAYFWRSSRLWSPRLPQL